MNEKRGSVGYDRLPEPVLSRNAGTLEDPLDNIIGEINRFRGKIDLCDDTVLAGIRVSRRVNRGRRDGPGPNFRRTMMRKYAYLMILIGAMLAGSCAKDVEPLRGVVDFIAGDVVLQSGGQSAPARTGDVLTEGMKLRTGVNSYARISVEGDTLQIYEKTLIDFSTLSRLVKKDRTTMEMTVEKGTVLCRVFLKVNKGDSFRVSSSTMVAAVRGTEFLYGVEKGRGVVACSRGTGAVRRVGSDEEIVLGENQMVTIDTNKKMAAGPIPRGYVYKDFSFGKNSYEKGESTPDRGMPSRTGPRQDGESRGPDSPDTAAKKKKTGFGKSEKKVAADDAKPEGAAKKKVSITEEKKTPSQKEDNSAAVKKNSSGAREGKRAADAKGPDNATRKPGKSDTAAIKKRDSGTKDAGKIDTAESKTDGNKKTVRPATENERRPGSFLVKPRVDEPEAK